MTQLDQIFSAMGDPTRRRIVELLSEQESTLLNLDSEFSISFQALSKHIGILENAGVIHKRREGKFKILSLNREALQPAIFWITHQADFWHQSFERLEKSIDKKK